MPDGTLLWGGRRLKAAILVGKPTLTTLVTDELLDETQARNIALTENIQREDLLAYEIWQAAIELLRLNPSWSKRDLADNLKRSASWVTRILSPSECIPAVVEKLKEGRIGIKACYEISKASVADQDELLAKALGGGSADAVAREGRKRRNGTTAAAVRTDKIRIDQAAGTSIVVKGDGLDLETIVESLAAAVKEGRKALADGLDAKTWAAVCRDRAKAGV